MCLCSVIGYVVLCFFFQAEDGIRDLVRSRGLGDVYKRQNTGSIVHNVYTVGNFLVSAYYRDGVTIHDATNPNACLLYTSDAADERSSVDLGGRRIIKKKKIEELYRCVGVHTKIEKDIEAQQH